MKFTVADLLDHLPSPGSLETSKLEKILKLTTKTDRHSLALALQALDRLGIVVRDEGGNIERQLDESVVEARLRCSSKGFCFALREDGGEDIYIRDHQLNHAWNGDRVLVKVTRDGGRRRSPEGGVQCILERSTTSLLAQVERQDEALQALPLDDRLLATIHLPEADACHLKEAEVTSLVEVKIDRYPIAQFAAEGHVARQLPLNGSPSADRDLVLTKVNLQERAAAPRGSLKAPTSKHREDLTSQPALLLRSWKVSDAPPLPAVHVEAHSGGCRLWVHAPAVAERLGIGNSLDLWLRERGEALCLGDVWHPLFNPSLTKASAFTTGEINEAVSVRLDISAEGELTDWQFCLSTIQPVAEINPAALDALAARKPKARTLPAALKPLKDQLNQLETLIFCAKTLQAGEQQRGAIELDLPIPSVERLGDIICCEPDSGRHQWFPPLNVCDPQSLLSPMLRASGRAWLEHLNNLGLPGLMLGAAAADPGALNDVAKSALALDVPMELDEEGSPSAAELARVIRDSPSRRMLELQLSHGLPDPQVKQAVAPTELIQSQAIAEAAEEDQKPEWMAPWCCPGLHYADLVNQQIIVALLIDAKDRPTVRHKGKAKLGLRGCWEQINWPLFSASQDEKLRGLCTENLVHRINTRRRQSLDLREDLVAMSQARYAEPLLGQLMDGVISGVQSYGFFVEIPPSMVEGLVHVSSLNDDWYEYRSRQNRLVGRKNRRVYQLGDAVKVKIIKVDVLRNQIDLEVDVASSKDQDQDPSAHQDQVDGNEQESTPRAVDISED
ncbi:MAG: RNB domain-containing ribonuclease [Prochlorococcus sp.]